jgi:hypothetical protein
MQRHKKRRAVTAFASLGTLVLISPIALAASPAVELVGPNVDVNETGFDVSAFGGYLASSSPFENEGTLPGEGPPSGFESRVRLFNQSQHVRDYYVPHFCQTHSGGGYKNTLAIGARGLVLGLQFYSCSGTTWAGSAIVYSRQGNDYSTSHVFLTPPAGLPAHTRYGAAVATHGDWIAVGAPGGSGAGLQGRVDMWRWNGTAWVRHGWLPSPAGLPASAEFGAAVAIHEDLMVVGAPQANMFYVYHREQGNWLLKAQYQGTAPTGLNVDITSSYLVSSKGTTVTIYRRVWNGWVPHQIITHPQFPGAPWGEDVAIDEHRLILGNPAFDSVAIYGLQGNYVHLGDMQVNLAGSPGSVSELLRFGEAVAIHNDDVIVGDRNARHVGSNAIGANFFQKFYWIY